jgi:hypothetical protein
VSPELRAALAVTKPAPTPDDVEAVFAAWRRAAEEMQAAWRAWCSAAAEGAADAYAVYLAAADRESVAGEVLERCSRLLHHAPGLAGAR